MSRELPIAEAKARFAACIRRAETGERVLLTRHGRPVAQLGPIEPVAEDSMPAGAGDVREPEGTYRAEPLRSTPGVCPDGRREALARLLEESVWPRVPDDQLDTGVSKREREAILGYGSEGI